MKSSPFLEMRARHRWTYGLAALCALLPIASFGAPRLEFEFGAGAAGADVLAPALSGRLGASWTNLTASLRALTVIGATPQYVPAEGMELMDAVIKVQPLSQRYGSIPTQIDSM